ncbi:hypothetical protein J2853_007524 [Streptosporangium lutulentum]|uniref:Uncharacterized protein n=1 Tax=Streptosporangium lutulentum TaxID=1461250 RepID=A0ABT9QPX0_9ACTN|nr:hypothetical protein [Streptosporangium lutulentum]
MPKPFSDRVRFLNACGVTFEELSKRSNHVRSAPWWCSVANGQYVRPPRHQELEDVAKAIGRSQEHVVLMVIEEWYGLNVSAHALELDPHVRSLSTSNIKLLAELARRLNGDGSADGAAS